MFSGRASVRRARGEREDSTLADFDILYFTGTGNTARAAEVFKEEARQHGRTARTIRVRRGQDCSVHSSEFLVVLFPVYAFAPPRPILSALRRISRVKGKKAVVIENHGMLSLKGGLHTGSGGGSPAHVAAMLRRKGYRVVFTGGVGYPENITILANAIPDRSASEVIDAGDATIRGIARDVCESRSVPTRYGILARFISALGSFLFNYLGAWQGAKLYVADAGCTSCGLCAQACPTRAIRLIGGRPRWSVHCIFCLGCFNTCPRRAVQVSILRVLLLLVATVLPVLLICVVARITVNGNPAILCRFLPRSCCEMPLSVLNPPYVDVLKRTGTVGIDLSCMGKMRSPGSIRSATQGTRYDGSIEGQVVRDGSTARSTETIIQPVAPDIHFHIQGEHVGATAQDSPDGSRGSPPIVDGARGGILQPPSREALGKGEEVLGLVDCVLQVGGPDGFHDADCRVPPAGMGVAQELAFDRLLTAGHGKGEFLGVHLIVLHEMGLFNVE